MEDRYDTLVEILTHLENAVSTAIDDGEEDIAAKIESVIEVVQKTIEDCDFE